MTGMSADWQSCPYPGPVGHAGQDVPATAGDVAMGWATTNSGTRGRVLVADDEPANVALLERVLAAGGFDDIHTTTDAATVASVLSAVDPDLVLLDWHMPPATGADVLTALRDHPRWSQVPVIVVTADPDARLRALDLGAADFLTKPFDHAEILLRVRNALRTRMLHQELQATNEELERRVGERTVELASANERLREAELVRQDFVAMASHEMRTPLTVIRGFADHWEARGFPPAGTGEEQVDAVRRNVRRLEHLVQNLLLASRVERGSAGGHREREFDLREVLDPAVLSDLTQQPVSVRCETDGRFRGDPDLLALVIANLVSNAARYGTPPIELAAVSIPGGAELRVSDHGPGVPEDFVDHLFERFTQATVGDRRHAQGTGLGLWVSRNIVEMHGGRLWYEQAPSGGASFVCRLPRAEPT